MIHCNVKLTDGYCAMAIMTKISMTVARGSNAEINIKCTKE